MQQPQRTILYDWHVALGAHIVEFGGWDMPLQYGAGIVQEHLATRKQAGIFDVSHMGRFAIRGQGALAFLQHVLANNAASLDVGQSQYTIIPNEDGGAIDDAYLYRFVADEYLLVVNAANRAKDWAHLQAHRPKFEPVELVDQTEAVSMISLQGPRSKEILAGLLTAGALPEPMRNALSIVQINGLRVPVARTGYTGEPLCFELFTPRADTVPIWDLLLARGAQPVGLGARDTLRLEAGLPLYGHELGVDADGREIPVFAIGLARFAVSFSPLKGDFIGKQPLAKQFAALQKLRQHDHTLISDLPRRVTPVALTGKGIARNGNPVFREGKPVGYITSGTMVPYWQTQGTGLDSQLTADAEKRAIGLALLDSDLGNGDAVDIDIRGKKVPAVIVPYHLRSEAPPYARAIPYEQLSRMASACKSAAISKPDQLRYAALTPAPLPMGEGNPPETRPRPLGEGWGEGNTRMACVTSVDQMEAAAQVDAIFISKARTLLEKAIANTVWRQEECINLIPSEQTLSPLARRLAMLDPAGRYAEHKAVKAFNEAEVFYYQGTDFISEVETLLVGELQQFLGCAEVETRLISGQMANTAVFSAMVDYINRTDRKCEPHRLRSVLNNHIIRGGHLSAQPMGALRDFVARNPHTEKPAVINFPVLADNPYKIDVAACRALIAEQQPELIILGKSLILHPEPVAAMRALIDELQPDCVLLYDMAHVLGLVGPHFQEPFKEGADLVTGSTHKTYFGTQRGIVAANYRAQDPQFPLWEAIQRRAFPGSVSNHHLGTLVGLLMAAYEMNFFKDAYQQNVLANAKSFARALQACGLDVAGDPAVSYTETHQVVVNVGYAQGPEIARRLEANNIIVNYQATPAEEGFTASGALRLGVAEMTRFGMGPADFQPLAQLMFEVIRHNRAVKEEVRLFRQQFRELHYCFAGSEFDELMQQLQQLI